MPKKCDHCNKDAVVVEQDAFYSCADCWLKRNAHKILMQYSIITAMHQKGKKNEKSSRVS